MITAIIQARMSSTRFPGKMLLPLAGKSIIENTVARVLSAKKISKIIVATSDSLSDDPLADVCVKNGIEVFRGSLDDVLDRYYQTAKKYGAQQVARITGDCPIIDPSVIDLVAEAYEKERCDYISTGRIVSTFPDGMDTEIFSFASLEVAWKEARLPSEREHVTPYIWNHPELFKLAEIKNDRNLGQVRLTIDEPQDYEVLKKITTDVSPLSMLAIVAYLEKHPEVAAINGSIVRDAGYAKSLEEDKKSQQK